MPLLDDLTGGLRNLYGNGGAGDPLISIGMGLLSQRGVGRGLAAGFQNAAQMSDIANQRARQAMLDKLAQERESRQVANDKLTELWRQKNFEASQANTAAEQDRWKKTFNANQANVVADNARADAAAKRPFVIGKDKYGREIYGTMQGGIPTPLNVPQVNQPPAAPVSDLHGEQYINTVDPEIRNQVLAIAQGRAPYPNQAFMKTPLGEQIVNAVQQYEPGFDATTWLKRSSAQKDLATGKLGQNTNALNTALGHLTELSDDAQKLNNYSSPMVNKAKNWINTSFFGEANVTNFNTVRDKVAEEFTRVYRGSGGSEADIKREIENLNAANSPEQLNGAIARMAELAKSKIEANQEQYNAAMGPYGKPVDLVSEKSKGVLDKLTKRLGGQRSDNLPPANSVAPFPQWSIEK